jgi:type IV pilus assembly protein PilC
MKAVVSTLLTEVAQGQALSAAAARQPTVFPAVFVSLLNAGEQSGNLSGAVRDIGAALTHDEALSAYARRIAIYPAIVGSILLLAVVIALVHVVPQLETLFAGNGQVLPLQTRVLVGLSRLAIDWGWALLAGLGLLLAAARVALARSEALRIRFDTHLLHLPLLGEIRRKLALARFAALFATLYAAGITVIDALRTSADVTGNLALREGLRTATERIEQGQPLSAAFDSIALFPPLIARMIRVGEHTGALDRALANVASLYRRDIAESIGRLQATLEPALTLLMGGLLLWIATAVLGPIYDIITQLPT